MGGRCVGDRVLRCSECGRDFVFTEQEQAFFQERGFEHEPRRCVECRRRRRRRTPRAAHGNARPAERRDAPAGERKPEVRHEAVCSVCGTSTTVPFVPDGVRPIFCLPCLKQQTR